MPSRSLVVSRETPEWLYEAEIKHELMIKSLEDCAFLTCAHRDNDHKSSKEAKDVLQHWESEHKKARMRIFLLLEFCKF